MAYAQTSESSEVLFVRVRGSVKAAAQEEAIKHGVSLSKLADRALEMYLSVALGVDLERTRPLP